MPWKERYTISDERTLDRVQWPDGAPCASGHRRSECRFGARGCYRRRPRDTRGAVRRQSGSRCVARGSSSPRDPGDLCGPGGDRAYPSRSGCALAAEGHEIAAHGFRHEDVSGLESDEERRRIARTTEILADVVGLKPAGWFSLPRQGDHYAVGAISANTIDLLLEAGYVYLGNGLADDIPYYSVSDFASRRALLTLPYYYHFDDQFFLMFPRKGTGLEHPTRCYTRTGSASSRPRGHLAAASRSPSIRTSSRGAVGSGSWTTCWRGRSEPRAWNATGSACARWFTAAYPAATSLRLEPSIWTDHPGSLS